MGAGRALPDPAARDRRAAYPLVARGVRRPALRGAPRHPVAGDAPRPAAVARRVRPGDAVAEGGLLRDAGARPAGGAAPGGGAREEPSAAILDSRTLRSTPESGARAGWDGHKRTRGSKLHLAVDTLGHLLALRVTAASENDRAAVAELAEAVQDATGENVTLAYVDQGYTGERPAEAARAHGIVLEVVAPPAAKRGFVLLPRRWVVERFFAWMARCRRLARDHERLPETLAGFHFVAFTDLMLRRAGDLALVRNTL